MSSREVSTSHNMTQITKFMGPTGVLSAPDGSHVDPMNLAFRVFSITLAFDRPVTWQQRCPAASQFQVYMKLQYARGFMISSETTIRYLSVCNQKTLSVNTIGVDIFY